jgi:hypothetical protein
MAEFRQVRRLRLPFSYSETLNEVAGSRILWRNRQMLPITQPLYRQMVPSVCSWHKAVLPAAMSHSAARIL